MKNHIKTYFQESSIHGFPYIVNNKLHLVEKSLWVTALIVSFICCGLLIFEIGVKMQEDALVTYTSDAAIEVVDVSSFFVINFLSNLLEDSICCRDFLSRPSELQRGFRLQSNRECAHASRNHHRQRHYRRVCQVFIVIFISSVFLLSD